MKNIIKKLVILFIMILTIFSIRSYTLATNSSTPKKLGLYNSGNGRPSGFYTTGTSKAVRQSIPVIKIIEYNSSGTGADTNKANQAIYCLKEGVGFARDEETGSSAIEYSQYFDMRHPETMGEYRNYLPTNEEDYNKLMWLLDNICIPEDITSVENLLNDAGEYTKQDFTDQSINDTQFKDIIEIIQQAAIWYITNKNDNYQPSSSTTFKIAQSNVGVGEDLEEKFNMDLEDNPIKGLYDYLISQPQNKGSYDYLTIDSSPLSLDSSKVTISYQNNLATIGPYKINATGNYTNFVANVYSGASKIENATILGSSKENVSGSNTTEKVRSNIGKEFYIQVPVANEQIKLEISSNKTIKNLTYWSTAANIAVNNQPVVIIDTTSKKYDLNNVQTIQDNRKTNVKITKVWNDENNQDGIRPDSIKVDLYANETFKQEITLSTSNGWTYSNSDLPMYVDGVLQNYTFREKNVPSGYTSSVQNSDITNYIISNTHTPAVTSLLVKKVWEDGENQDGIRPGSITVELLANGQSRYQCELNQSNSWSHTFSNLPVNESGSQITYTLREKNVPQGYNADISFGSDTEATITNKHTPGVTEISVNKVWSDLNNADGSRPNSITVELLKNGDTFQEYELNSGNGWSHTFTGLPVNQGGNKITYTVREKKVPDGYTSSVTGDATNGFTITNTHTPDTTQISVRKNWADGNNQDGIRPNYITVELLADGTKEQDFQLSESNNWSHTFTDLPEKKNGNKITYTVQEKDVPQSYSQAISGDAASGFVITNSYTPKVTQITVNKEWADSNDKEGKRPNSVTVELLANGNVYQEHELNDGNHWNHTFTNLPVKQNGNDIVYTVREKESTIPATYMSKVTGNVNDGFKITNTYQIFDLALRKYITKINGKNLADMNIESRNPVVEQQSQNDFSYKHKKDPILVQNGDVITYQITVYNEGERLGCANQITDQLPNGLRFSKVNTVTSKDSNGSNKNTYNVTYDENTNRITFEIVKSEQNPAKGIKPYDGNLDFETIEINCIVDYRAKFLENNVLTNVAWINSYFDVEENREVRDVDSQSNSNPDVNKDNMDSYKGKSTNPEDLSDKDYYYQGEQDDDDFEKVYLEVFDLALRKFATAINDKELSTNGVYDRAPVVDIGPLLNGEDKVLYKGSKEPLKVQLNDVITYTIRVYNEGKVDGYAEEITDYLPPELEFLPNDEINKKYLWTVDSTGRIVTTKYLTKESNPEGNLIKAYQEGSNTLNYKDVQIRCRIKPDSQTLKQLTNISEISETNNEHGTPNVDNKEKVKKPDDPDLPNYKGKDTNPDDLTDDNFYYEGQEDDDDFEKVVVEKFDLALKKFVTGINEENITSRVPNVDSSKYGSIVDGKEVTDMEYSIPNEPLKLANNDIVIYTIRVYNEGTKSGYASEIKDNIPENLVFLIDNDINKKYKWILYDANGNVTEDIKNAVEIRTNYLSKENETEEGEFLLKGFDAQTMKQPDYKDVQVAFRVLEMKSSNRTIKNRAEISKDTDEDGDEVDDIDSTPDEWKDEDDDQSEEQVYVKFFDLALDKVVSQVILIEDGVQKEMDISQNQEKVVKVELDKERIENTIIKFKYQLKVTNEGEIEGYATEISDYIPDGLKFNQADNPKWKEENGKIITDQLKNTLIQPKESVAIDVVLTWVNGDNNLNTKTNVAEISKDENPNDSTDIDSTPNNQKSGEDDMNDAQVVLTVATGSTPMYIAIITGITFIIGAGAFMIKKYVI